MRIIFSGDLRARWMTGWQRCQTLKQLGHDVIELCHAGDLLSLAGRVLKYWKSYRGEIYDKAHLQQINDRFLSLVNDTKPDLVWVDKVLTLLPETIAEAKKKAPACQFVCYQDDDPFGFRTWQLTMWRHFIDAIPLYDFHFVKKEIDLIEFREHGARRVEICLLGFFPDIFHPVPEEAISAEFRRDVAFVGTAIDHRVRAISELIGKQKVPVHVYGDDWYRTVPFYRYRSQFHAALRTENYVSLVCGSKICLGFVSSLNRDEFNGRTFEIPACGGFFLAERTPKHLEFYEEGKEAEFFSSVEECADKVQFYLRNEPQRLRVARAGHRRALESDYSYKRRLTDALAKVKEVAA